MSLWKSLATLIKIKIAIVSTFTAITGFVLSTGRFPLKLGLLALGVFLMAAGSAALNQYQERHQDGKMERTKHRPLPAGQLKPVHGLLLSLSLIICGFLLLALFFGTLPPLLGLCTVFLYNVVYIYLKPVTAFAIAVGAMIGVVPPAIGWTAGGGSLSSPALAAIIIFFYLWQVPHFWLLMMVHADEYHNAGYPRLSNFFTHSQLGRITFTWVLATACAAMHFPLFGMASHTLSQALLITLTGWLGHQALALVKKQQTPVRDTVFLEMFRSINIYALLIMIILVADHGG